MLARIAAHPNVIGIKDSSANISLQQELIGMNLTGFAVLTGSANTLAPSGIAGAAGGIVAFANLAPEICLKIWQSVQQGKLAEARELQLKIVRLNTLLTKVYGVGGLKYAIDLLGRYGGQPRRPLTVPGKEGRAKIRVELEKIKAVFAKS